MERQQVINQMVAHRDKNPGGAPVISPLRLSEISRRSQSRSRPHDAIDSPPRKPVSARHLFYSVTINHADPLAVSAAAQAARGDLAGSSFAFDTVSPDDEEWHAPRGRGDLPLRILWRLKLIDVAPVAR